MPLRRYCFQRVQRLLKPLEFKQVFEQPFKSSDRYFTILTRRGDATMPAKLGITVSRKHSKLAVQRNRLKRLIRESFRLHQHLLVGLECVVLARQGTADEENAVLTQSLIKQWKYVARRHQSPKKS